MGLSSNDIALYRDTRSHSADITVNAVPLTGFAVARINQSSFTYPLEEFDVDDVDGDWADMVAGMAFSIGTTPGAADITWGVVRKPAVSDTFYPDVKGLGDPGFARSIHGAIADNQWLTVWKHRPPWGMLSSIRSGIFYKQWDIAYTDQGSSPDPVAQFGNWRQAFVDPITNTALIEFDALLPDDGTGKRRSSFAWGSKTLTDYLWSVDGGTITVGSTTTSAITVEFDPGFYVVELWVTDDDGKIGSAFRYVWVNTLAGSTAPFSTRFPMRISRDSQDHLARGLELTIHERTGISELYPGQGFMLHEDVWFAGGSLEDDDARIHTFVGYSPDKTITRNRHNKQVSVRVEGPMKYARRVPNPTQQMSEVVTPNDWTEVTSDLSNPPGAVWYLLNHHAPQFIQAHGLVFNVDLLDYRKQNFVWQQASSIGSHMDMVAGLMLGVIGCRSDGTIVLAQYGSYMSDADRNALDEKYEWTERDIRGDLVYNEQGTSPIAQAKAASFAFDAADTPNVPRTAIAVAPDQAQAQGTRFDEITFICPPSNATTERLRTRQVAGHKFAWESAKTPEFGFMVNRNIDIAEPVDVDVWHGINVDDAYDPPEVDRMIPISVTRDWAGRSKGGQFIKKVSVDWRSETSGQLGRYIPVTKSGASTYAPAGYSLVAANIPTVLSAAEVAALLGNNGISLGGTSVPDQPPASPSALDDEFSDGAVNLTLWDVKDTDADLTYSEGNYGLVLQRTNSDSWWAGLYQAAPAGDFTIWTKVSLTAPGGALTVCAGLIVTAADPSGTETVMMMGVANGNGTLSISGYSNSGTGNLTTITGDETGIGGGVETAYIRIRRSGSDIYMGASLDGAAYMENVGFDPLVGGVASVSHFGVGLMHDDAMANWNYKALFRFFRYTNSDVGAGHILNG